jgi:hypothetical protein
MMALMVLSSTFSFAIEKHYCGDFLIDSSIFTELKKCNMDKEKTNPKPCCKDTLDLVQGQDELQKVTYDQLDFKIDLKCLTAFISSVNYVTYISKPKIPFFYYHPPDLVMDIQLLDEVFLI